MHTYLVLTAELLYESVSLSQAEAFKVLFQVYIDIPNPL